MSQSFNLPSKALLSNLRIYLQKFISSPSPFTLILTLPPKTPIQTPRTLTVLDSSFNPPTHAHASMLYTSKPQHVLLLLAISNADKVAQPEEFVVRLAMMQTLGRELVEDTGVGVDIGVTKQAYFHDKAKVIAESGVYPGREMVFLAGFDTLVRILDAKYYEDMHASLDGFFGRARLQVTLRPDDQWGSIKKQRAYIKSLEDGEAGGWVGRIEVVNGGKGVGISSSRVRRSCKMGDDIGVLVTEGVREWIVAERLYLD